MKFVKIAAAAALALLVGACLFTPGKFDARMSVMKDGTFTYRYDGEIFLITGHSAIAAMQTAATDEAFDPDTQACWGPAGNDDAAAEDDDVRDCTPADIENKRKLWEESRAKRLATKQQETAAMKAMLGGIDPTDPATMTEFARRLQGQGGWKKVVHKGEGVFDVEFEIAGRLTHDFVFPVFDGVDFIVPFVQVTRRAAGKVHVAAPALVATDANRMGMSSLGAAAMMSGKPEAPVPFKAPEGSFTLVTDAAVLTNNSREGPSAQSGTKTLRWTAGPLDKAKPEALLQF